MVWDISIINCFSLRKTIENRSCWTLLVVDFRTRLSIFCEKFQYVAHFLWVISIVLSVHVNLRLSIVFISQELSLCMKNLNLERNFRFLETWILWNYLRNLLIFHELFQFSIVFLQEKQLKIEIVQRNCTKNLNCQLFLSKENNWISKFYNEIGWG